MDSQSGQQTPVSFTGTYQAASNGFLRIQSLVDGNDIAFGGIGAIGPSAFTASATEGQNYNLLVGIPAGSSVSNASLNGSYNAGYIDFLGADATRVRGAAFTLNADGQGGFGTVVVSGSAADLGSTALTQNIASATYSLPGAGAGTVNFGASASGQLISGSKVFYISADGNLLLGGAPNGFDLLVGIRSLTGVTTNASYSGVFYVAGIEDSAADLANGNS